MAGNQLCEVRCIARSRQSFQSRSRPLGAEEEEAVVAVLRSGWVTQGEQVAAFERGIRRNIAAWVMRWRYRTARSPCIWRCMPMVSAPATR